MQCLLSNLDISYFEQVQGHNGDNHSAIETTFVCQFPLYCKYTSSINSSTSNLNLSRIILLYPYSFFCFYKKCLGWTPCPQSVPTVSVVSRCPSTEKEWISAAGKKNCRALRKSQNCSEDGNFVYHCVLSQEATELMEVCAPIWYMAGMHQKKYCINIHSQLCLILIYC